MKQAADVRPDPTFQRKAAIVAGGVVDHAGAVRIEPIPDFDLDRTIFQTLEGKLPRYLTQSRIAREVYWSDPKASAIQSHYDAVREEVDLPSVDPDLLEFMNRKCDFDVEHAEGSFLDHLYFGFEYCVQHYPEHSPLVMFLHSILGTGTNTFAMEANKIPDLKAMVDDFEWRHIEAFPSVLRLLYTGDLRDTLRSNQHRLDRLDQIRMRRVIDNAPLELSGQDLWIQLNYQLVHLIDFLPVANWSAHRSDPAFIIFRDLYTLLDRAGKLEAHVSYRPSSQRRSLEGEQHSLGSWLVTLVPVPVIERAAKRSVSTFSKRIGHDLDYDILWS